MGSPTKDVRVAPVTRIGDFEIAREIGRGSMGVVYEAIQLSLGRRVALKTFPTHGKSDQALERFKREAGAASKLVHPGIVPVYSVGDDDNVHYYAMKLVEGKTLRELIYTDKIPPERSAKIAKRIAEALDYAHKQGVIHRDIKPTNVIVQEKDQPVITDFGLAKDLSLSTMTQAGIVLGTPTHMSPEQAAGAADVDHRTDIYALGACLYEMLSYRLPFNAQNLEELLDKVAQEEPERLKRIDARIPLDLEAIVMKALAKRPSDRYASAGEMADDLGRFLSGDRVRAERLSALKSLRKWTHKNPIPAVAVALVLALSAGAVVSFFAKAVAARGEQASLRKELEHASSARDKTLAIAIADKLLLLDPSDEALRKRRAELEIAREREASEARRVRNREEAQKHVHAGESALQRATAPTLSGREKEKIVGEALDAFGRALGLDPENSAARAGRGRIYLARALQAESEGDDELAAIYFGFVREHNPDGLYDGPLRAEGAFTVRAQNVPGARVRMDRVTFAPETGEQRREPVAIGADAERPFETDAPYAARAVTVGSYLIEVTAEGFTTAVVSLTVERDCRDDLEIMLLREREIPPGFAYVPSGPARVGGDRRAIRPLTRERRRIEGFFMAQRETTCEEYARFLSSVPPTDAEQMLPRGGPRQSYAKLFWRDPKTGKYRFPDPWPPERPVTGVGYDAAARYAAWRASVDNLPIRLPNEFEWEKAARGGDGRSWPWGESEPFGRANVAQGDEPGSARAAGAMPQDVSIYGCLDMIGNASEWTSSMHNGRQLVKIVRGGSYMPMYDSPRPANRYPTDVANPHEHTGIRLACDLPLR